MTKIFSTVIFCITLISICNQYVKGSGMIEVFRWKQMDFYNRGDNINKAPVNQPTNGKTPKDSIVFPDQLRRRYSRDVTKITSRDNPVSVASRWASSTSDQNTSQNASYIPYNNVPMGATHYNGRLFITMPRRRVGIPSTLNYIDMKTDGNNPSPKLKAYPDFETNYLDPNNLVPNDNRIISVYRTSVDACKRLWFIDTGVLEYPDNRMQIQQPAIWIYDLNTDRPVKRFAIPESIVDTGRGLASITIDVSPHNCEAAYAYIPDLVNSRLYVYSLQQNRIWSFTHNYFNFDPIAGDLSIGGQNFRWDDGIFSVTLGPYQSNGYRTAFFHAMASNNEFMVSTEVLQNEANAARSDHGQDFQLLGSRGNNRQSTMHEYDPNTGVLLYDEIHRNGIGCWNTKKPFSEANHETIMKDDQRMIYPSDLTIDEEGTMWVMSNSMPIFIYSSLDTNAYNFRVWKQNVFYIIKGTGCM